MTAQDRAAAYRYVVNDSNVGGVCGCLKPSSPDEVDATLTKGMEAPLVQLLVARTLLCVCGYRRFYPWLCKCWLRTVKP